MGRPFRTEVANKGQKNMRKLLMTAAAATAMAAAAPAFAAGLTNEESTYACTLVYTSSIACQGYYGGNIDGSNVANQQAALNELYTSPTAGVTIGGPAPTVNWGSVTLYDAGDLGTLAGTTNNLYFGTTLYGLVTMGFHFGNNSDPANPPPNVSAFYIFDFGAGGADHITFTPNANGFSDGVLYASGTRAVPEPATWAMMLLGFAGIGASMRRRRRLLLAQIA